MKEEQIKYVDRLVLENWFGCAMRKQDIAADNEKIH